MKLTITRKSLQTAGHLGPVCIACSNAREFWVHTPAGAKLVEINQLPEGEVWVVACGKCRSRRSIVVAHVD
jgi:hypothetical protein